MKQIKNMDCLEQLLSQENPNWQEAIFEQTGVAVLPEGKKQHEWALLSRCGGSFDLDFDTDEGDTVTIESIHDLAEYICGMELYRTMLADSSYGQFTKSELLWALQSRLVQQNKYIGSNDCIYGIKAILDMADGTTELVSSVCGVDDLPGMQLQITAETSLEDAVEQFAVQMEAAHKELLETGSISSEEVSAFVYSSAAESTIPDTMRQTIKAVNALPY